MGKNVTTFDWIAAESAPKHYPMEIIQGTFLYKGEDQGLYIPSGGTLDGGWGKPISSHVVGPERKPLPDRLQITFFSYAESQFYRGEFTLPYDVILQMFQDGVAANEAQPTYSKIIAGIAPGGVVAVWLHGQKKTEIFFGQAEKVDLDPSGAFNLPFDNKADSNAYVEKQLLNTLTPAELDSLRKDGVPFGLWSRYRKRYQWMPVLATNTRMAKINVRYVNGETEKKFDFYSDKSIANTFPVPKYLSFHTSDYIYTVAFDEIEIMNAFEKLGREGKAIYLEVDARYPRSTSKVRLVNIDKESIQLHKMVFDDW